MTTPHTTHPQSIPLLQTVAGDWEPERFSRQYNFIEAVSVMLLILVALWIIAYPFGVMFHNKTVNTVVNIILVAGGVYLLFVAPFLHKDSARSWGLGNPIQFWQLITTGPWLRRITIALSALMVFIGLNILNYTQWFHVARFFKMQNLASFFGWDVNVYNLPQQFPGVIFVVLFGSILSFIITTSAIRYDNFLSAFKTAMSIALPLLLLIVISAYVQRGKNAFADLNPTKWIIDVFGYVFWGFVQQLLFSSYFGTRFRKAFAPSRSPDNQVKGRQKIYILLLFGGLGSLVAITFASLSILLAYGSNAIPDSHTWLRLFFWLTVFFFPLGAVYGYYYAKDRKRILVATFSASCFGLIHIDSYGLVSATWILGTVLVYVFMEDRNRNLVALGFIHGTLGSSLQQLFSRSDAGVLEIDYSVGPWNVEDPTWGVIVIPIIIILLYVVSIWSYLKYIPEAQEKPTYKPVKLN